MCGCICDGVFALWPERCSGGRDARTLLLGVSGVTEVLVLGLLRSPARGKPARHNGRSGTEGRLAR